VPQQRFRRASAAVASQEFSESDRDQPDAQRHGGSSGEADSSAEVAAEGSENGDEGHGLEEIEGQ
jgi:hypothetical protein